MKPKVQRNIQFIGVALIGLALFLFLAFKAYYSSFTHDESYSYLHYTHQSYIEILSFKDWYTNNHIMNSLLMKMADQLLGNSEFFLRLPNLILFIVYMFYAFQIFRSPSFLFTTAFFVLLCTNPLMYNLFGLARGYGLSFGFMMMSLYHYFKYHRDEKKSHLYMFHIAAVLATLSSFTLLLFYVALLFIDFIFLFLFPNQISKAYNRIAKWTQLNAISLLLSFVILYEPVRRVLFKSKLDFGGKTGFYADTVRSLIDESFYGMDMEPIAFFIIMCLTTMVPLFSLGIIVKMTIIRNEDFFSQCKEFICLTFLVLIIPVMIVLQHVILESDYPLGRFAVFLFPLWVIQFGMLVRYLMAKGYRKISIPFVVMLALVSLVSLGMHSDPRAYGEWAYDANTKDMMLDLQAEVENGRLPSGKIRLGVNWLFAPTINFYRTTKKFDWLLPVSRNGVTPFDDFNYIFTHELDLLEPYEFVVIKAYAGTNTVLIKHTDR